MQGALLYYTILFVLSVVFTCIYVIIWDKHFSVNLSLIFLIIPVVCLGYYIESTATNAEAVIAGIKMTYLGGSFLPLFITYYIFHMCRIGLPRWARILLFVISLFFYGTSLTIGQSSIFYRSITIEQQAGKLLINKVYGPLHGAFVVCVFVFFLLSIVAISYSLWMKNEISRRITLMLYLPAMISLLCYVFQGRILDSVEILPAGYVLAQIVYLVIAHYTCLYEVSDVAVDSINESGTTGFISFDFKYNYLGSNPTARKIFLNLNELIVDYPLKRSQTLNDLFLPQIKKFENDEKQDRFYYQKDDMTYQVIINYLIHDQKKHGYQLIVTDDTQNQNYISLLNHFNDELEDEVERKTADVVKMHNRLLRSMAKLVESRDNSTGGHIVRTSDVVEILMGEIVKDKEFVEQNRITDTFVKNIIKAAPLHDIGKIAVPDAILQTQKRYTPAEFEKMKVHAAKGAEILYSILEDTNDEEFRKMAENVAHYHHERMDGSGYPEGLKGEEIPLEARIMAIADVYDALVSKRCYKDSMSFEKADSIMMDSMGKHFDIRLKIFYLAARPKIEDYYRGLDTE